MNHDSTKTCSCCGKNCKESPEMEHGKTIPKEDITRPSIEAFIKSIHEQVKEYKKGLKPDQHMFFLFAGDSDDEGQLASASNIMGPAHKTVEVLANSIRNLKKSAPHGFQFLLMAITQMMEEDVGCPKPPDMPDLATLMMLGSLLRD